MRLCQSVKELYDEKIINQKALEKWRNNRILSLSICQKCSLQCPYCVGGRYNVSAVKKLKNVIDEIGINGYLEKIDELFGPFMPLRINIPGSGEPSESPYFVPIVTKLFELGGHIKLQSNLHGSKNIEEFALKFPKSEIRKRFSISASYHLGSYLDRNDKKSREKWLYEHFPRVVDVGCRINTVITPMTPDCIRDENIVMDYRYMLSLYDFPPTISELYHQIYGKPYPSSYTKEESIGLTRILNELSSNVFDRGIQRGTEKQCDQRNEQMKYLTNHLELKGMPCYVGMVMVEVLADGRMRHCQADPEKSVLIGNIKNVKLKDLGGIYRNESMICKADRCVCKSAGNGHSLYPNGLTLQEYYYAWYMQQDKPKIAGYFGVD